MDFIFEGNNFSVFMYGQTNSGKTFTMKGNIQDYSKLKSSKKTQVNSNKKIMTIDKKNLNIQQL